MAVRSRIARPRSPAMARSWRISATISGPASIWVWGPTRRRTIWSRRCARQRYSPALLRAATIGGATALMRDDLGRIAPNSKAELVLVDLTVPQMRPVRDPLRSFIYHAADRAVRDVFVDGRQVVADHKVLTMNQDDAADRLAGAAAPHVGGGRAAGLSRPQRRADLSAQPAYGRMNAQPLSQPYSCG